MLWVLQNCLVVSLAFCLLDANSTSPQVCTPPKKSFQTLPNVPGEGWNHPSVEKHCYNVFLD